jgi:NADPH:quinone reductase-like Zn-dependent oxidoreductase
MHAVVIHRHGGVEALRLEEVPDPSPGPGQAVIRVRAVAVNRLDIWVRENIGHAYQAKLPLVLGYDAAGEVAAVGPAVDEVGPGDRVYVHYDYSCGRCGFCLEGEESLCSEYEIMGVNRPGAYAELVLAPTRNLFALGDATSFEAAAATGSVYLTAYHMLFARGELRAGETVLVMAAGSGVGGAALQLARWAGASVLATAGTEEKRARAVEDGALAAIDYTRSAWPEEVLALTNGRGVNLIIDHVGASTFDAALHTLAPKGRLVICGATSGAEAHLDLIDLFVRQLSVIGSSDGTRPELAHVLRLLNEGVIAPRIDAILPLEEVVQAHERLEQRDHYGRILLDPR